VGVTTSTAPMVHPRTKLAAALAKTTLITMANRRQVDDLSEVEHLQQEEEAAQLSQIANHEKDNGWHSTGPQCWICARWREVCFEVRTSSVRSELATLCCTEDDVVCHSLGLNCRFIRATLAYHQRLQTTPKSRFK